MVWNEKRVGDLGGKTIIVTGANSGIGLEATKLFCKKGATVIMGCRSRERGNAAVAEIQNEVEKAKIEVLLLDLSSLESIHSFVQEFLSKYDCLDILCNNAGVMALATRVGTKEGLETQTGVNHFGHFALTGLLLEKLMESRDARVVTVSSAAHWVAQTGLPFQDIKYEKSYNRWRAYCQSKLMNLTFAKALDRKLKEAGISNVKSIACHPGYANSNLQQHSFLFRTLNVCAAQSCYMGCLPTVMAATEPSLKGGELVGPRFVGWGLPAKGSSMRHSTNVQTQDNLWEVSQDMTKVRFLTHSKALTAAADPTSRI